MKRIVYIALIGIGILGLVYAYLHRQELGLTGSHTYSNDATPADEESSVIRPARMNWQQVDRSGDGFKVDMPSDIKELQIPAYNESGGADQVSMIYSTPDATTTFSVVWGDDPPVVRVNNRVPDRILDMARDEALARTQTTLVTESRSTPGGFPARDFSARNAGGGVINSRLIVAGQRLYMLIAAFPSSSARRDQDVTRFFNSFSVVGATRIPAAAR